MATKLATRLFSEAFEAEATDLTAKSEYTPSEWSAAGRGKTKTNPNGEDGKWWRTHGPDMVQSWIEWRNKYKWRVWDIVGTPAIELPIDVEIPGINAPIKAIVDRVMVEPQTKELVIVDLKTGSRTPESDLQLGFYAYGIRQLYGVNPRFGAYWMARKGELTDIFPLDRYTDNLIETMVRRFVQARELGLYIPHPTFRCRACSLRDYCAVYGGSKSYMDPDAQEDQ